MSDSDNHWHLDKRLNAGHLLTTIAIFMTGLAVINELDNRITTNEARLANLESTVSNMVTKGEYQAGNAAIVRELNQINDSMERLSDQIFQHQTSAHMDGRREPE